MELYNRILKLRPKVSKADFEIRDESTGDGPYISSWDSVETQPTQAEIDSVDHTAPLSVTLSKLRQKRDQLISATDWAALPDSPTMSDAMTAYRTALRDYPATYTLDNSAAFPKLGE